MSKPTYEELEKRIKMLENEEARYKNIFDLSPYGIITTDLLGKITSCNSAFLDLTGFEKDQIVNKHFTKLPTLMKQDIETYKNIFKSVITGKSIDAFEFRWIHNNGSIMLGEARVGTIREGKKIKGMQVFLMDITESKKTEEVLREKEFFLTESQRAANIGSYVTDFKIGTWKSSKTLDDIFGIDENYDRSVEGWLEIVHPDSREELNEYLTEHVIAKRQKFDKEYQIIKINNKEERWVHGIGEVEFDEKGNITQLIGTIQDITGRKKAEEDLKKFKTISDRATYGAAIGDLNGKIIYINEYWAKLHGYKIDELLGKHFSICHTDEQLEHISKLNDKLLKNGYFTAEEAEHVKKDGSVFSTLMNCSLIKDDNDKPLYMSLTAVDVTDKKKIEFTKDVLYEISRAVSTTADIQELFGVIHKLLGTLIDANNFYISLYDKKNDLITYPYFIDEKDKPYTPYMLSGSHSSSAYVIRTKKPLFRTEEVLNEKQESGELKLVGSKAKIWLGVPLIVKRNVIGVMAVQSYADPHRFSAKDIELMEFVSEQVALAIESKRDEEELRRRTILNQKLIDAFPCFALLLRPDRTIIAANKAGREMGAVVGETCKESLAKRENPCPWCLAPKAMKTMELQHLVVEANGIIWDAYWIPIEPDLYLHFAFDITKQHKTEVEKKKLEEQLIQSQKMESIGRLAGGIAHDFNNILTSIMGYAELLKLQFPDENSSEGEAADVILRGAERASNLTQQLLGFARKGRFNPKPLNVNVIIKETVEVSEKIFEKKIRVDFNLDKNIDTVEADGRQLDQVLTNLIINAKDAMPTGGSLTFKTENIYLDQDIVSKFPELLPGKYVKISVMDTGTGIPKKIIDDVFEPFFSTKGEGKGTGLGLATVYGIIKNHNGHIHVASEPGKSTTFTIYLPVTLEKIAKQRKKFEIYKGSGTVLIVDDEAPVRQIASIMLRGFGYEIIPAENGIEAIQIFRDNIDRIDLVLLDIIMPEMDGIQTLRELRKIDPTVKVVLSSGYSKDDKAAELVTDGAASFIQKPYKRDELSKVVIETMNL